MKKLLILMVALLPMSGVLAAEPPLPGASIYQLDIALTDQAGDIQKLAARRGTPQLVTMFYTSCTMVCPIIIDTLKMTRKAVGNPSRQQLGVLAVSFDPEHDDVGVLHSYADAQKIDLGVFTLARAEAPAVRQLAAVLGLQYRQLPDKNFNHSSQLVLLDREGRIIARTSLIGRTDPEFVAIIRKTIAGK